MRITVVNLSSVIAIPRFHAVVAAIRHQAVEDFAPAWAFPAPIIRSQTHRIATKAKVEGIHDAILYLGDSSQDPTTGVSGALGYHSENHAEIPYGFVYLDVCAEYNEEWTTTLSHEVLELLGDPKIDQEVPGPAPHGSGTVHYDMEVCDPTQGDTYVINGVTVSNFVTRTYFFGGFGKTNFLDLPLERLGVRPGGYLQYSDSRGSHQIFGTEAEKHASKRAAARAKLGLGRRNTRRAIARETP